MLFRGLKKLGLMERRLLSVIIPMYNAEKFIASMIKAIQNQSYTNFEVIIVDDQSTDNSVEVVKKWFLMILVSICLFVQIY